MQTEKSDNCSKVGIEPALRVQTPANEKPNQLCWKYMVRFAIKLLQKTGLLQYIKLNWYRKLDYYNILN